MARSLSIGLASALALACAMTATSAQAGCRRAGGEATMVTKDLAVFTVSYTHLTLPTILRV